MKTHKTCEAAAAAAAAAEAAAAANNRNQIIGCRRIVVEQTSLSAHIYSQQEP